MVYILGIMGALLVLEGIPYFAFPNRVKQWAQIMQAVPERNLRMIGLITMGSGLLVLYLIRYFQGS